MAKCRLVVCFDGTWNTPDKEDKDTKPTNVVKIVRAVRRRRDEHVRQVTFYDKGVGTAGGTDAIKGGAFGAGLIANIMDGYRFIANNHVPEDEIYIFGFSRGAYTARSLAGVIGLAGLLAPQDLGEGLLNVIRICQDDALRDAEQKRAAIEGLELAPRREAAIRCLGVWDTVGSLGIPGDLGRQMIETRELFPRLEELYFPDVELGAHVDVALHAVAIDEKRGAFAPTLWVSKDGRPKRHDQTVEQVWFAGAHSNVGGSYPDSDLSDIAFDWMVRRVSALTHLSLEGSKAPPLDPAFAKGRGIDSRTALYVDSRVFPYQRVINGVIPKGTGFGEWFRRRFPDFDRRNIPPDGLRTINEALHVSALERWKLPVVHHDCREGKDCEPAPYRPVNLAAVIEARHSGRTMPVVGWDGRVMDAADEVWPQP